MGKTKAAAQCPELKTKGSLEFRVNSQTIIADRDILPCRQYTFPLGWSGSTKPPQVAEPKGNNESTAAHVRTTHEEYERAELKPRPKLSQNLRSTRQTELCQQFPSHVVSAWIGNSESVAKRHSLQATEDHFQKASGVLPVVTEVVATPVATKAPDPRRIKLYLRR